MPGSQFSSASTFRLRSISVITVAIMMFSFSRILNGAKWQGSRAEDLARSRTMGSGAISTSRAPYNVERGLLRRNTVDYFIFTSPGAMIIRGAIAIILGIVALLLPGPTFLALTIAFGVFALLDGISALITFLDRHTRLGRGWLALEAVAGVLVGIITMIWPGIAALNLVLLIAAWALVTGALKIAAAIRLRKRIRREWLLVL